MNLLIIEDNRTKKELLIRLIHTIHPNIKITCVEDLVSAEKMINDSVYNGIILNMGFPRIADMYGTYEKYQGLNLIEWLNKNNQSIPILVYTTQELNDGLFNYLIVKDVVKDVLVEADKVRQFLMYCQ